MYALTKRTISKYLRGECRRRLRLDLYANDRIRENLGIPTKDVMRPGLALLTKQGRKFEREKFAELSEAFVGRVIHGELTQHHPGEELAFGKILLADHLDACEPDHFLIEAEYGVTAPFITAHALGDLQDGSAFDPRSRADLRFAKKIPALLHDLGWVDDVRVARLSSGFGDQDSIDSELRGHVVVTDRKADQRDLVASLDAADQNIIVAGTAQQLVKLIPDDDLALRPLFDFMLIDEASQLSVSHAVVAFTTLAEGAALTVVGDDLQMPPIQPVAPPDGAEHLVGSVYDFFRNYRKGETGAQGIAPVMLDRSYRSNREIVEFVRQAGYGEELMSVNAGLRMRLAVPLPAAKPQDWPAHLDWHGHLATLLDPEEPLTALIHPDEFSSQRNEHEANLVAGLVRALYGRLLPSTGVVPLSGVEFFNDGIGIVTPHRAQQAAVVEQINGFLTDTAERAAMMATVDTVERFQGQEKTVMIASFGLGDRDQIAAEEEFLYSLNRFNVIASRAKAKLIVIMSRRLVDHLPRDPDVLRKSRLVKHYADGYLLRSVAASIPGLGACEMKFR
ncbi:DEAD/DEAH box helicase [Bosea beijingensis]|uniref:DEAD/DEAH box helicase n=1 Tax=Bosea beijingensis TaxID=3068632 RepID=UPI002741A409|nr:DEAD/DEAH box helicase [Bosea sp. REN20]